MPIWYAVEFAPVAAAARSPYGETACVIDTPGVVVDSVLEIAVAPLAPSFCSETVAALHSPGSIRLLPVSTVAPRKFSSGSGVVTCATNSFVSVAPQVSAALARGAGRIVVGLGGSATTDGGSGLVEALGGTTQAAARLRDIDLVAASDVENPLLGPLGAAAVFGPQKGADDVTVARLEERMTQWSRVLSSMAGRDISGDAGAGAAGIAAVAVVWAGVLQVPAVGDSPVATLGLLLAASALCVVGAPAAATRLADRP